MKNSRASSLAVLVASGVIAAVVAVGSPAAGANAPGRSGGTPASPVSSWRDDFNRLDTSTWRVRAGGCLSPNQVKVSSGMLRLTTRASSDPACPLLRSRIDTYNRRTFASGTFSARIRFDLATGSWQTFWLTGGSGLPFPANGEVDIAEILGRTPTQDHIRLHSAYLDGRVDSSGRLSRCTQKLDPRLQPGPDSWHVYSVTTSALAVTFKVDGKHVVTFNPNGVCTWPFIDPMRIILGAGGGGGWGGPVDPSQYPVTVLVDWVSWTP